MNELTERQRRGAELIAKGASRAEVVVALGVTKQAVSKWFGDARWLEAVEALRNPDPNPDPLAEKPWEWPQVVKRLAEKPQEPKPVKKPPPDERVCRGDDIAFGSVLLPDHYPGEPSQVPHRYAHCHWCGWRSAPYRSGAMAQDGAIAHLQSGPAGTSAAVDQYGHPVLIPTPFGIDLEIDLESTEVNRPVPGANGESTGSG